MVMDNDYGCARGYYDLGGGVCYPLDNAPAQGLIRGENYGFGKEARNLWRLHLGALQIDIRLNPVVSLY